MSSIQVSVRIKLFDVFYLLLVSFLCFYTMIKKYKFELSGKNCGV